MPIVRTTNAVVIPIKIHINNWQQIKAWIKFSIFSLSYLVNCTLSRCSENYLAYIYESTLTAIKNLSQTKRKKKSSGQWQNDTTALKYAIKIICVDIVGLTGFCVIHNCCYANFYYFLLGAPRQLPASATYRVIKFLSSFLSTLLL